MPCFSHCYLGDSSFAMENLCVLPIKSQTQTFAVNKYLISTKEMTLKVSDRYGIKIKS